jgi:hypothetical protein
MDRNQIPPVEDVDWPRALVFLERFDEEGFIAGHRDPWQRRDGVITLTAWEPSPVVAEFIATLYSIGAIEPFDWGAWQPRAAEFYEHPGRLDTAGLADLRRLLTFHVRRDRFVDGHLGAMFEEGHIQRILRRIQELTRKVRGD